MNDTMTTSSKIDWTKPIETTCGLKAVVEEYRPYTMYCYAVKLTSEDGVSFNKSFDKDGFEYDPQQEDGYAIRNTAESKPKIDWTKPIETTDGLKAVVEEHRPDSGYPYKVQITEDYCNFYITFDKYGYQFGPEQKHGYTVRNVVVGSKPKIGFAESIQTIYDKEAHVSTVPAESKPIIDWTKPLRTKVGKYPARLLADNLVDTTYPIACAVMHQDGKERVDTYTKDGFRWAEDDPSDFDLENVPEAIYVNIYKMNHGSISAGQGFATRAEADTAQHTVENLTGRHTRTACIRLEGYEGRFDA